MFLNNYFLHNIKHMNNEIKLAFWDCDGSLVNTPLPEYGKDIWSKYHNKPYPHIGWWSKLESMCLDAFDIKTVPHVHAMFDTYESEGYINYIHTSRMLHFKGTIQQILDKNGIIVKDILTKKGNLDKGDRILEIVDQYIKDNKTIKHILFVDDRQKEVDVVENIRDILNSMDIGLTIFKIKSDALD